MYVALSNSQSTAKVENCGFYIINHLTMTFIHKYSIDSDIRMSSPTYYSIF